jgi:hypothetical protein
MRDWLHGLAHDPHQVDDFKARLPFILWRRERPKHSTPSLVPQPLCLPPLHVTATTAFPFCRQVTNPLILAVRA